MGAPAVSGAGNLPRSLRIRQRPRHGEPGRHPFRAARAAVAHAAGVHASGIDAAAVARAASDGGAWRPRAVRGQPLCAQRHRADHGEGRPRLRRVCPAREGSVGLREDRAGRLVRRRVALAPLPGRSRASDHHRHAGRRSRRHSGRGTHSRRRSDLPGRPCVAGRDARGDDRSLRARRGPARRPRCRTGSLRSAQSASAAVCARVRRALPCGPNRAAAPANRVGARDARAPA